MARDKNELPAGDFSAWLAKTRTAQIAEKGVDVPCGKCNACCRSSYFIHIRPDESRTLAAIPDELLFPAPGLPKGHVLMGYDENGRCPMLVDNVCSIYEQRPLTCRTYDCRIFPATGIEAAGGAEKFLINQQIQRWKFSSPAPDDSKAQEAVQAAALFLQEHADCFPAGFIPGNPTQLAILAIKVYDVFLEFIDTGIAKKSVTAPEIAQAIMAAEKTFEAGSTNI